MTLVEQFPDISKLTREKNKLNSKCKVLLFEGDFDIITPEQKFYDREFRIWHYKVLAVVLLIVTGIYFLVLNGRSIINWLTF